MEFGKHRWKVLGFELRNHKPDRSKALWKASALIGAVVVGMVMETLRRRSKSMRKVSPEVTVRRGRVQVALRTGSSRRASSRRSRARARRVSRLARAIAR